MRIKKMVLAVGCAALLCGCTKSNIVNPETPAEPDFNLYSDIVLDEEALRNDVNDIYLDPTDYPMGKAIDFSLHLDEGYVDVVVVVKDGTSPEDAAYFAEVAIKGINDEAAVQDFSYGESDVDTFGGLYQDNEIRLKVYEESAYQANGEPIYEAQIPKDAYQKIEIGENE